MSEFVNTKDVIGNQKTLDGILSYNLTEFADEDITELATYAFNDNFYTKSVVVPNVKTARGYTLRNCRIIEDFSAERMYHAEAYAFQQTDAHQLTFVESPSTYQTQLGSRFADGFSAYIVDYTPGPKVTGINGEAFRYLHNCFHLILRLPKVMTLGTASSFCQYSPIATGYGWIYVPDALLDTLKETTGYVAMADRMVGISTYPKSLTGETITDTWAEILEAEGNGTYTSKYSLGDTKFAWFRGEPVLMQIVAFDTDILSDDSGYAKISWMTYGLQRYSAYNYKSKSTLGGWAESEIRQLLIDRYYNKMDTSLKPYVKQVKKYSRYVNPSGTVERNQLSNDYIWIPSWREMTGDTAYENTGGYYTSFFTSASSRTKNAGVTNYGKLRYLTRTLYSSSQLVSIYTNGTSFNSGITATDNGVVFGFCT